MQDRKTILYTLNQNLTSKEMVGYYPLNGYLSKITLFQKHQVKSIYVTTGQFK